MAQTPICCLLICAQKASKATQPKKLWVVHTSPVTKTACRLIQKNQPSRRVSVWARPREQPVVLAKKNSAKSVAGSSKLWMAWTQTAKTATARSKTASRQKLRKCAHASQCTQIYKQTIGPPHGGPFHYEDKTFRKTSRHLATPISHNASFNLRLICCE